MSGPDPASLATIPIENERRARLYDALWKLVWYGHDVSLWMSGGLDLIHHITVDSRTTWSGTREEVERGLTAYAEGLDAT